MYHDFIYLIEFLNIPLVYYTLVISLGLLVGSFLNVVIYRFPQMMEREWLRQSVDFLCSLRNSRHNPVSFSSRSDTEIEIKIPLAKEAAPLSDWNLAYPRSHCPKCNTLIRWFDNIPILSYLLLRGKCRRCNAPIPMRYLGIELLTAILSGIIAFHWPPSWTMLGSLCFTWFMIALTFIDIDEQILPDDLTLLALWLGLFLNVFGLFVPAQEAIIGAICGYLVLWTLYWGFKLLTQKEGMGYGDFKLMACVGAWLGWKALPLVILFASLTGTVWGLASILLQFKHKEEPIPFGPFIAVSAWITLIWGDKMIQTYLQWIY